MDLARRVTQLSHGPFYLAAARLTFGALLVHVGNVLVQVIVKLRAVREFKLKRRETPTAVFNRYASDDPRLLAADRIVGNFLEWIVVFIGMVWLYACYVGDPGWLGGVYLVFRCAYVPLSLMGGIHRAGVKPRIYLSTVPQYLCLIAMGLPVFYALFVPYENLA